MTSHIAIAVVGVLCAAAVVFGVGMASAKYHLSDIGGWLPSAAKGEIVHVNGLSGKVDGKVKMGTPGHAMKVVQQNGVVLLIDEQTGIVSRIDPAQLAVTQSHYQGAQGVQIVSDNGSAYAVQPGTGSVQRLDPNSLATMGSPVSLTGPLGSAGIDEKSSLWVPVPTNGQAAPVSAGAAGKPVGVGKAGDDMRLTIASGSPVVTDFTAGKAAIVGQNGVEATVNLPPVVAQSPAKMVKAPAETDGQIVPILANGSLVMVNSGAGSASSVNLELANSATLGEPQALGQRVYIPNKDTGSLVVYNSSSNKREPDVKVTKPGHQIDAFVKDGFLWANDDSSQHAVVIDSAGGHKDISKYSGDVPGGNKNPIPKNNNPAGNTGPPATNPGPGNTGDPNPGPAPHPGHPGHPGHTPATSHTPKPPATTKPPKPKPQAPDSAVNPSAKPLSSGIDVSFSPSPSNNVTNYTLQMNPNVPGVTLDPIPAAGPTYEWQVKGGDCGTEYQFVVLAHWQDGDKEGQPVQSATVAARPCTTPGQPTGLKATATSGGTRVTWNATPGQPTYHLKVLGHPNGTFGQNISSAGQDGPQTSATLSTLAVNGAYRFSVTSSNAAGTSAPVNWSGNLTGPPSTVTIHRGGTEYDTSYVWGSPASGSTEVAKIKNANGVSVRVLCQVKGAKYTHPRDSSLSGTLYDRLIYQGKTGYMIGYLPNTGAGDWDTPVMPRIWDCG